MLASLWRRCLVVVSGRAKGEGSTSIFACVPETLSKRQQRQDNEISPQYKDFDTEIARSCTYRLNGEDFARKLAPELRSDTIVQNKGMNTGLGGIS